MGAIELESTIAWMPAAQNCQPDYKRRAGRVYRGVKGTDGSVTYHLAIAASQAWTSEETKGVGVAGADADYQSYQSTSGDIVLE
jgi:hypothetical protein